MMMMMTIFVWVNNSASDQECYLLVLEIAQSLGTAVGPVPFGRPPELARCGKFHCFTKRSDHG